MAPKIPTMAMKRRKTPQATMPPITGKLVTELDDFPAAATPISMNATN